MSDNDNNDDYEEIHKNLRESATRQLFNTNTTATSEAKDNKHQLNLRDYQNELASDALNGENVVICAPTGSGKTMVAVKIVKEHLDANPTVGKVAFLVNQVALVDQQLNVFEKYLNKKIIGMSGGSKTTNTPLKWNLKNADILVLTAEILKTALEIEDENKLESINTFSMIIFDECHNVDNKHPYNRIMTHYFKAKKSSKVCPQIIGLTASIGTDKAKSLDDCLNHLYTICANLDSVKIKGVEKFEEELLKIQSLPNEDFVQCSKRSDDWFDRDLQNLMQFCEESIQDLNKKGFVRQTPDIQDLLKIPANRMHSKYYNFLSKLDKDIYNETCEQDDGKKSVHAIYCYLKVFSSALMINHLFRSNDAIEIIQEELKLAKESCETCPIDKELKEKTREFVEKSRSISGECNPCLEKLKEYVKDQFKSKLDSRIIVFVRERIYTDILRNIFSKMPSINCEKIVGGEGQTKNEVQQILSRFKAGDLKVLFSTSVMEEGIDVPKCNMVIRYGHITNETSRIQTRGRARSTDSKYIVIVPLGLKWQYNKEQTNKEREMLMYQAIDKFKTFDKEYIHNKIKECQLERELFEGDIRPSQVSISTDLDADLHCRKCSILICTSKDMRRVEQVHHVIINEECFKSLKLSKTKDKNQCHINCASCDNQLGSRRTYKNRMLPSMNPKYLGFVFDGSTKSYKNWKDVPLIIPEIKMEELAKCSLNHSLSA